MPRIVIIQFITAGKLYDFDAGDLDIVPGDKVIVETERGLSIGSVVKAPIECNETDPPAVLTPIRRKATPEDLVTLERNAIKEKEAHDFCMKRIMERSMQMKLVRVEYLFDGSKAIFFFTADGRVDFRDLVKDLAHCFHTRIEMRQIGVRDESKMVGGIGICGRELCCCSFLREFQSVSVKMAKEQNLALNPSKISGQCGRLLCCLDYEYETYCALRKTFPKCGRRVRTDSVTGVVDKLNILTGNITLKLDDGKLVVIRKIEIVGEVSAADTPPQRVEAPPLAVHTPQKVRERRPARQEHKPTETPIQQKDPVLLAPAAEGVIENPPTEGKSPQARKKNRFRKHGHRKNQDGGSSGNTPPVTGA